MNKELGLTTKFLIVIGLILFIGCAYYVGAYYHQDVKSHKQMYCYDTSFGPANSALIVTSLSDGQILIDYYKTAEHGNIPVGNFPLQGLPIEVPVYVMGYVGEDSLLADVVSYWNGGGKSRNYYLRGYVYTNTLHEDPPQRKKLQ